MGLFDFAKDLVTKNLNKFSGNTDFLEAVCAGAAIVAYADGSCSDEEVAQAMTAVEANPTLTASFKPSTIETTLQRMMDKVKSGSVGRVQLKRELADIRNKPDMAEIVLCTMIDVASASGDIDPKERTAIVDTARSFGLDPKNYGL